MKIIHLLLGKANPLRMNGVNKVAFQLAKTQHQQGADVHLWGITANPVHDYPQRAFPTTLFTPSKWGVPAELRQAIAELEADTIVHLHGVFIPILDRVARLLYQNGIAYVITPHGALAKGAMEQNGWKKQLYFRLITRRILKRANCVQMLGEAESADLFHLAPEIRQVLIPNGQEMEEIPQLDTRPANQVPVIGFCGRMDAHHKGLDLLLDAFKRLLDSGTSARLLLIGDGKDRQKLQAYCAEQGIADQVVFMGARYGEEKFMILHLCDFFIHTSRMEGFPMALLEAAALGLPLITTPATSMNRFLKRYNAGIAIERLDVDLILEKLQQACSSFDKGQHQEMSANAKRMVIESFDWTDIAEQLLKLYQRCLAPIPNQPAIANI